MSGLSAPGNAIYGPSSSSVVIGSSGQITATTASGQALTVTSLASMSMNVQGGTDNNTTLTVGQGGATPTLTRSVDYLGNTPSSVGTPGRVRWFAQRAGVTVWQFGINEITNNGPKINNDDFYWFSTQYAMALTTAGALTTASGITVQANGASITGNSSVTGTLTVTSSSASAYAVGANGATNPALLVDASTASSATGIKVKSAAVGAGVALSAISSGAAENLTIDALGTGTLTLNGTATGQTHVGHGLTIDASGLTVTAGGAAITGNSTVAGGFAVYPSAHAMTNSGGLAVKGSYGLTNFADTSATHAEMILVAGDNAGANTTNASYLYMRNSTLVGLHGYTSNTVVTIAGYTKTLTDFVIGVGNVTYNSNPQLLLTTAGNLYNGGTHVSAGIVTANQATGATAGGAAYVYLGSSTLPGVYMGSGAPTISAPQGSLYLRTDGSSTATRAYINNSAGSGATWTAITTAA